MANGKRRPGALERAIARFLGFMAPGVEWDGDQKNLIADGMLGNIAATFVNPFMTPFALGFGASKFHVSLLNAFPGFFGNVLQVPASYLVERTGRRKSLIVLSGILTRVAWGLVILLPLFTRQIGGFYALLALMVLISAASAVVTPAWTSLVSDIIPRQVRGRFFSARNILMSVGALLSVNFAGQIVTRGGFPSGYMASATVFWALSWASLFFFTRVRDVPFSPSRTQSSRRMSIDTEALHNPRFSTWIKITVFFNFFVGLCGSLFGAYLIQDLGGTPAHLASMSFLGGLTGILGQRFWGPVSDRRGPKFAVVTSAYLCAAVPVLWYVAKTPWAAIVAETFSGAAWSGWGLCSFNLILDMTPEGKRPSYVATANLIGGIAAFIAPLIGGYFAMKYSLRPMMLVSAVGRFATGYLLQRFISDAREVAQS